jgi:tripartite-type tricarboxylate transporter receptor subunit TctC
MLKQTSILMTAAAAMAIACAAPATAGFYDGKDVTVIVNAGAGGGLTRTGRLFTTHMKKHLGKDTNMVIKNIAGGGGVKGMNFLVEKAKKDGLTILWGTPNAMAKLLGLPGVRYDPKTLNIIGAGSTTYVSLIRADVGDGLKSRADLLKLGKPLIIGGRSTTDGLGIFARLPMDVLGVKYRYVPGYNAQPKLNAAIRAKEIQSLTTGHPGYHAFYKDTILKSGEALALYYHSPMNASGEPARLPLYDAAIKNFLDFYKENHGGKEPSGQMWEAYKWFATYAVHPFGIYAPPGVDAAKVGELRTAFANTVKDPVFVAAYSKRLRAKPNFLIGKDAEYLVKNYDQISADGKAGLKKLTARKKK